MLGLYLITKIHSIRPLDLDRRAFLFCASDHKVVQNKKSDTLEMKEYRTFVELFKNGGGNGEPLSSRSSRN
jgi:hypothetical protein